MKFKKGETVSLTTNGKMHLGKDACASLGKIERVEWDDEDQEYLYYVSWDGQKKERLHYNDEIALAFPERF